MDILTPAFRVSYPKVFKAEINKLSGKAEYSLVALFTKGADLSALKKAAEEALIKRFGSEKAKWPKNLKNPFRDQGEKAKTDEATGKEILPAGYEKGAIFLTLKSTTKPGLVDQSRQEIIDETKFYAGCFARATVSCYAYDQAGNRGVNFGLSNIQFVKDGDSLSGRVKAEDAFTAIADANTKTTDDLFG